MDEMTMVRDLLAEPAPPEPDVATAARRRLEGRMRARSRGRGLLPTRRRLAPRIALGAVAAGVAAALVTVALLPDGTPGGPALTGAGPAGTLTAQPAREFLLAMATKAGHSQPSSQATGLYWCSEDISGTRELVGPDDTLLPAPWLDGARHVSAAAPAGYLYAIFGRSLEDSCLENPRPGWPGGTVGGFTQSLGATPASPADAAAWRHAGSPDRWKAWYGSQTVSGQPGKRQPGSTKAGQEPWGSDMALPANPAKLRAVFLAHPLPYFYGTSPAQTHPTQSQELVIAAITVMSGPVTPAVRAAAFQVLAGVPGIVVKPGARDPEGRVGTAVWLSQPGQSVECAVVDPATGNLLDYEEIALQPVAGAPAGTVLDYTAITGAHWTNTAPPEG
jgi:hypothetical protein